MLTNHNQSSNEIDSQQVALHRKLRGQSFKKMTFQDSLTEVGAENWYQIRCFIVFCLEWVMTAFILSSSPFIFYTPPFDCAKIQNQFGSDVACNADVCNYVCNEVNENSWIDYLKDPQYITSITVGLSPPLICNRTILRTMLSTAAFIGSFIGFFLFSWIADNKGRVLCLRYSWLVASLGAILMGISNSPVLIFIGYFFAGFGANPAITVQYSFMNEHSQGKFREYSNIGVQMAFALGQLIYTGLAYLFPDWKILVIYFTAIPMVVLNLGNLLVFESPKYKLQSSIVQAIQILNKIAVVNKKQPIHIDMMQSVLHSPQKQESRSIKDFFKYKSLSKLFYCALFIFFSVQAVYYGVLFIMGKVGINVYVNCVIIFSAEFAAYSVTGKKAWSQALAYRQQFVLAFYFYRVIQKPYRQLRWSLLEYDYIYFSQSHFNFYTNHSKLLRFIVCFVWTIIYIFFSELFPTVVRSLALGITSAGGSIGSQIAPFLVILGASIGITPMVFFGAIALLAVFHVSPLNQTLNKPLKNQIQEEETDQDLLGIQKEGEFDTDKKKQAKAIKKIGGGGGADKEYSGLQERSKSINQ